MLRTADAHYRLSVAVSARALREARKVKARAAAVALVVAQHQATLASESEKAMTAMLAEQGTPVAPEARIDPLAFTTQAAATTAMLDKVDTDWQFDLLVASLVQDAGRAAESVSITTRPGVGSVRYVSPPCCSRCAVLAGRFYRHSEGFQRHPGCDCTHLPTTDPRSEFRQNPHDLVERGLVRGLSKADMRALADGADLNRVVNVRRKAAGLKAGGQVLSRAGKPTPAGIYRIAGDDRDKALALLKASGYIR